MKVELNELDNDLPYKKDSRQRRLGGGEHGRVWNQSGRRLCRQSGSFETKEDEFTIPVSAPF